MAKGEVRYKLTLDEKDFSRGAKEAQKQFEDLQKSVASGGGAIGDVLGKMGPAGLAAAAGIGAVAAGVGAFAARLAEGAAAAIEFGGHLSDLSAKTGISVEALAKLKYAGSLVGVGLDQMTSAVTKMQKEMVTAPEKFKALGISMADLKSKSPDQQLALVAKQLSLIQDPAQRSAAAISLMGKAGAEMIPLLTSNLAAATERAQELGLVMSSQTVAGLDATGDAVDTLKQTWDGLWMNMGATIVSSPEVAQGINAIADALGELSTDLQHVSPEFKEFMASFASRGADVGVALIRALGMAANGISVLGHAAADFERAHPWLVRGGAAIATMGMSELARSGLNAVGGMAGLSGNNTIQGSVRGGGISVEYHDPEAARKAAAETLKLLGESTAQAQAEMDKLAAAISRAGGMGALSASQLDHVSKEVAELAAHGAVATGAMANLAGQLAAINAESLAHGMSLGPTIEELKGLDPGVAWLKNAPRNLGNLDPYAKNSINGVDAVKQFEGYPEQVEKAKAVTVDWSRALQDVQAAFSLIGVGADSVISKMVGLAAGVAALGKNAKDSFANLKNAFGSTNGMANSGIMGKLGAGLGFAGTALSLGATLFAGLKGLFHKPSWEGIGKDAAKGLHLGEAIGAETAKAIEQTMKSLHVNATTAGLLNLDQIMGGSKSSAGSFAPQILQLMDGIAKGSVPASEGLKQLSESFGKVSEEAMKASAIGNKALASILQAARKAGGAIYTTEMKAFSSEQLSKAAGGVQGMVGDAKGQGGIAVTSEAGAAAQATIFSATFWGLFKEKGFAAVSEMQPAFEGLMAKLTTGGFNATALLGPIATLFSEMTPEVQGVLDGVSGLQAAFEGLSAAGYMTQASFDAFGQSAVDAYHQATDAGLDQNAALAAIAPMLGDIIKAHEEYGLTIDDSTQALIDQAAAAGVAFPTDPIIQMTQAINDLIAAIREANGLPPINPIGSGGGDGTASTGGGGGDAVREPPERHAQGGYIPHTAGGKVIRVSRFGGEHVVPDSKVAAFVRNHGGGAGGAGMVHARIENVISIDGHELQRYISDAIATGHIQTGGA